MMQDVHSPPQEATAGALLTTRDVQRLMRVDRSTIYRMAETGRLPAIKVGRQWRFPEDRLRRWLQAHQNTSSFESSATLGAALSGDSLQAVSDFLAEATGTMVIVTDLEGRPLAEPSNACGLFTAAHQHPGVLQRCIEGWHSLAADVDLEAHWRVTPFGFLCARSLVRNGGHLVGMVIAGGVAPPDWPPSPRDAARLADALGVPAAVVTDHAAQVHHLSIGDQDRVLRLLPRTTAFLSRLAAERGALVDRLDAIAALAATSRRSEP